METKNEKFTRMLETRLPKAEKSVTLLANLARKSDYEWTDAQMQELMDRLDDAVDVVAAAFGVGGSKPESAPIDAATDGLEPNHTIQQVGPVNSFDKMAIKAAYMEIAKGDRAQGMKALRKVILGWAV
jgi:hypothetical protein